MLGGLEALHVSVAVAWVLFVYKRIFQRLLLLMQCLSSLLSVVRVANSTQLQAPLKNSKVLRWVSSRMYRTRLSNKYEH